MADNTNTVDILQVMSNPLNLQTRLIDHLESKLLGGNAVLVDPNSVAMHVIEGFSEVTADYAFAVQSAFDRRLPTRAQTMSDLYLHMSDYDFVGRFATPSKAVLALGMDRNYILQHGVQINNYRELHIPKDTIIELGTLKFSLYYPIRIQVDERTKVPLVTFDIDEKNPLHRLDSNTITSRELFYLNYHLILMNLPIYQFEMTTKTVTLNSMIGYSETFNFTDKYYIVRLYTDYNGKRIELSTVLSEDNYDPTRPTARIKVMEDTQKFSINIPQVYFTKGMMGHYLYIELYTTKGDITSNIGNLPANQIRVDFNLDNKDPDPFTDCLKFNPTLFTYIISPSTTEGTNGYTYEEMRARVIRDSYNTKAQITPIDLQNYYADYGIKVERYEDNLTNIMYFIYKPFKNSEGQIVPSTNTYLKIRPDTPQEVSSIKTHPDGSMTILPTTWFRYMDNMDMAIPLTDTELRYISEMDKQTMADEFNDNQYVRTPFHIRLIKKDAYPVATSYNLMQPSITAMTITEDNPNAMAQMLAVDTQIEHEEEGRGGYLIRLIVQKSVLNGIPEEALYIYLCTKSVDGITIATRAKKTGTVDDFDLYTIDLKTSYWITKDDEIEISSFTDGNTELNYKVPLTGEFDLVYMVDDSYFPTIDTPLHMYMNIPKAFIDNKIVLLKQACTISFGSCLDDCVLNLINLTWDKAQYKRHQVDIPNTYLTNILEYDKDGLPILEEVNGKQQFKFLHKKGETVIGEDGQVEYLHKKGDLWLDTNGLPVVESGRINEYLVQAAVFDGKLYISEHPLQKDFVKNLVAAFETNFKIIRAARGYVTERTTVHFKPAKTMGSAKFEIGNGIQITMGLDLKLRFKFHVDPIVNTDDELKETTRAAAIKIIEPLLHESLISQTRMAEQIKTDVFYVESVDCLGINDERSLQTLSVIDSSCQPSIKKKLVISEDNQIVLKEDISIDYVDVK